MLLVEVGKGVPEPHGANKDTHRLLDPVHLVVCGKHGSWGDQASVARTSLHHSLRCESHVCTAASARLMVLRNRKKTWASAAKPCRVDQPVGLWINSALIFRASLSSFLLTGLAHWEGKDWENLCIFLGRQRSLASLTSKPLLAS